MIQWELFKYSCKLAKSKMTDHIKISSYKKQFNLIKWNILQDKNNC